MLYAVKSIRLSDCLHFTIQVRAEDERGIMPGFIPNSVGMVGYEAYLAHILLRGVLKDGIGLDYDLARREHEHCCS